MAKEVNQKWLHYSLGNRHCNAILFQNDDVYRKTATTILRDSIHKEAKEFAKSMIIKSKDRAIHVSTL